MSKKKSKGDKPETLSKKKRKELEAREAELAAELAKREKKADERDLKSAKKSVKASEKSNAKAAKKAKKDKASVPERVDLSDVNEVVSEEAIHNDILEEAYEAREVEQASEPVIPIIDHSPEEIRVAAHKVLDDPNSTDGAREKAQRALDTADMKERVRAKKAEREARDAQYAAHVKERKADAQTPLSKVAFLQSTEVEHQQARLKESNADTTPTLAARELTDLAKETVQNVTDAVLAGDDDLARVVAEAGVAEMKAHDHVAEVVETERGRVFETGVASDAPEKARHFVKPSDAPKELEVGGNGYKIIMLGTDGKPDPRKVRQMTRMTTYVNNIDDETTLKKWEKRMIAEGLAADMLASERDGSRGVPMVVQINDIAHRRDVKIAKAIKADRKGKLGIGELGHVMKAAEKEAKDALDAIVEQAAHLAGRNDKANLGTHLHTLAEIRDEHGLDRVRELHESGDLVAHDNDGKDGLEPMPVTVTDLATVEAYDQRMTRLGAKVLHMEAVVVDDDEFRAGRLDRVIEARLPELVLGKGTPDERVRPADQRARRYIMDLKSGNVELGAGKIARQLTGYALGKLYDLETGERTAHRAARDVALVFHIPQGEGVCHVYAVDLKAGAALLKLSGEVRRARNTGKKTIDTSVDIADPATDSTSD